MTSRTLACSLFIAFTALFSLNCRAEAESLTRASLPSGGVSVIDDAAWDSFAPQENARGRITRVAVKSDEGLPFRHLLRCETLATLDHPWDFQFQFRTTRAVARDEVLLLRFFARSLAASPATSPASVTPLFEKGSPPYDKSLSAQWALTPDWQEICLPFKVKDNYAAGEASVGFHLGPLPQTVEIADFAALSFGTTISLNALPRTRSHYAGQEPDAAWRHAANERINLHRKGTLTVCVTDAQGKPIRDAEVEVTMTRHTFGWGSAVVASRLLDESGDGARYREVVENSFNRVVFENDMKWGRWDDVRNRAATLKAVDWLRDRQIEVRGHCLIWPSWKHTPRELESLANDPNALRRKITDHIRDEATTLRGKIVDWDVINEPFDNNDVMKVLGDDEMLAWFRLAHECDPDSKLTLNDYSILVAGGLDRVHQDHFEKTLRFVKDGGAPITGLGIQSHFADTATPPERMLAILDRFGKLGLEITITEHDISSDDETFQSAFTRDFLTTVFSHPAVTAVLTWGFWEGAHWKPNAAYYRRDWSATPAGEAWNDLVKRQWWTRERLVTGDDGTATTRGFLGDYQITVRHNSTVGDGRASVTNATLTREGNRLDVRCP